jgi:hypothetical protein
MFENVVQHWLPDCVSVDRHPKTKQTKRSRGLSLKTSHVPHLNILDVRNGPARDAALRLGVARPVAVVAVSAVRLRRRRAVPLSVARAPLRRLPARARRPRVRPARAAAAVARAAVAGVAASPADGKVLEF